MLGIIIFFVILAAILAFLRYYGNVYYLKLHPELAQQQAKTSTSSLSDDDDDETALVISAAAFAALGPNIKITKIHFIDDEYDATWKRAGRMSQVSSHNIHTQATPHNLPIMR